MSVRVEARVEAEAAQGYARVLHHTCRRLAAQDASEDIGASRPRLLARRRNGLQLRMHLLLRCTVTQRGGGGTGWWRCREE